MQQVRTGFELASSSGREMLRLWRPFWHVTQPWNYIYIALSLFHGFFYPQGPQSLLFTYLWVALFIGLKLLMVWNWANAVVGARGHIDLQDGWENPDWHDYTGSMLIVLLAIPLAVIAVLAIPTGIIFMLGGQMTNEAAYYLAAYVIGAAVVFVLSRLLPISAALIAKRVSPLPYVWKLTEAHQISMLTAVMIVSICDISLAIITGYLYSLMISIGLARLGFVFVLITILISFFMIGWFVLLSQRTYALLSRSQR